MYLPYQYRDIILKCVRNDITFFAKVTIKKLLADLN